MSSPGGILLFRETSKVICTTGVLLIGKSCDETRKWNDLYKPISLVFNILRWSLVGKYVNFGVFDLYNDAAFSDAMSMYFQLLVQIPLPDMMVCLFRANNLVISEINDEQYLTLPSFRI